METRSYESVWLTLGELRVRIFRARRELERLQAKRARALKSAELARVDVDYAAAILAEYRRQLDHREYLP